MSLLVDLAAAWEEFFFAPVSSAILAVFRIAFGLLLLYDAAKLLDFRRFAFAPDGVLHFDVWHMSPRERFSLLHWLPPTMGSVNALFALHFVAAAAICVGFLTPLAIGCAFVALTSLHHRNTWILNSGDTILRMLCALLLVAHSNAACSIDALLWPDIATPQVSPWPLRLMQLLVTTVYLKTVFWKLRGEPWRNGSAVYYVLHYAAYDRGRLPRALARVWFYRTATWATLATETALGLFVWIDVLRYPTLLVGLLFHLTMHYLLDIAVFQWVMLCSLLLFLDPVDVEHLLGMLDALPLFSCSPLWSP
jgi:hypothetical protein